MLKEFELWLDESGDFEKEEDKRKIRMQASLVGGLLVEKAEALKVDFKTLVQADSNHAMKMTGDEKLVKVLPALETMHDKHGAIQVFFENASYSDMDSSRQLYLYIISEGILQLVQYLNACYESIKLEVIIAHRMDHGVSGIGYNEYASELSRIIRHKKNNGEMLIDNSTEISFSIMPADHSEKLQLADFACNTRLTRGAEYFQRDNAKRIIYKLHENALVFTMSENSIENIIKQQLVRGNVSDAIIEYATNRRLLSKKEKKRIEKIFDEKLRYTSYRLIKSEMKLLTTKLVAYVAGEADYENSEAFLKSFIENLLPMLNNAGVSTNQVYCNLLLQLTDAYLREGDTLNARQSLEKCESIHAQADNQLEEINTFYQILEKKALLEIDEFNYTKAIEIMNDACAIFETVLEGLQSSAVIGQRFGEMHSEYYGDALCMKIYAMMFLQRFLPESYDELTRLSDLAIENYPSIEGELERHRQYRSRIEAEAGNYEEAIRWLALAKEFRIAEINEEALSNFLKFVSASEANISCQYYAMYYMLIMAEAERSGDRVAEVMWKALSKSSELLGICGISEVKTGKERGKKLDMSEVAATASSYIYHPIEIVYWKYAYYCSKTGRKEAAEYYKNAIKACFDNRTKYFTMRVTGIGIKCEYLAYLKQNNEASEKLDKFCREILDDINRLLAMDASKAAIELLEKMKDKLIEGSKQDYNTDILNEIGRYITY